MTDPRDVNATRPVRIVNTETMAKIFEITDAVGVSRENVRVPLVGEGEGRVSRLPDGRWEIVVPATGPLSAFLAELLTKLGD
ncbi:MAG: hypothetical protein U0X73_02865 [Thermoanaerobaculia bacterium]